MVDRSFKVYSGEDQNPISDLTEELVWEDAEFVYKSSNGESSLTTLRLRDINSELSITHDYTPESGKLIGRKNRLKFLHGSNTLWTGRVADGAFVKGARDTTRYRELELQATDYNEDLRGIVVDNYVRPAETDKARVQALVAAYLTGQRPTTVINGSNYVSSSNTVTLEAKTYNQTDPMGVLTDIVAQSDKFYFVTRDGELFYDGNDSVAYRCPYRFSDVPSQVAANPTHTFPLWRDDRRDVPSQQFLSAVRVYYGSGEGQYVIVRNPADEARFAKWEEVVYADKAETAAQATAYGRAILARRSFHEQAYSFSAGPFTDAQIGSIKPGQLVSVQSAVFATYPGYLDVRMSELHIRSDEEGKWFISMVLGFKKSFGIGDKASTMTPQPPTPSTGVSETLYEFLTWDAGQEHWDHPYNASTAEVLTQSAYYGGAAGTSFAGTFGSVGIDDAPLAVTPGWVLHVSAWSRGFGQSNPCTPLGFVNWSWGVKFYDISDALISDATLGSFNTYPQDGGWEFSETNSLTVPTGAVYMTLAQHTDAGLGCQPNATHLDQLSIYIVTGSGTTGNNTSPVGGPGEGGTGTAGTYAPIDHVHEHGDLSDKTGTMHAADEVEIDDAGAYFTGTTVEAALQELGAGTGGNIVTDHGTMGAAETFDATDGHDHEGVQDANLTVTLTGATLGEAAWMTLVLTQDSGGGNTLTMPASVANGADLEAAWDTTADAVNVLTVFSYDGGTTWYGFLSGSGGGASALDDLTDVTTTSPAASDRLHYDGTQWVNTAAIWRPLMDGAGAVITDGATGEAIMALS